MSDPATRTILEEEHVIKIFVDAVAEHAFLTQGTAEALMRAGHLVPFQIVDEHTVRAPRLPCVTYPHEWCPSQLLDAARCTLNVARMVLDQNYELKDASAWNVVFDGCSPRFCDLGSFRPIEDARWVAMGQFLRHFVFPFVVARHRGVPPHKVFMMYPDGLPLDVFRRMMGLRLLFSRYFMFVEPPWPFRRQKESAEAPRGGAARAAYHDRLYRFCEWLLPSGEAAPGESVWSRYVDTRVHYSSDDVLRKRAFVEEAVRSHQEVWCDIGANTGEYSHIVARSGQRVVSIDADPVAVDRLYREAVRAGLGALVHPVVADVCELGGSLGWAGRERLPLLDRIGRYVESVLFLGVIHHVICVGAQRLDDVTDLLARLCKRTLVIELVAPSDVKVQEMMRSRGRRDPFPSMDEQARSLSRYFTERSRVDIGATRRLCVMQRNA